MAVAGIYSVGGEGRRNTGYMRTMDISFLKGAKSLQDAQMLGRRYGLSSDLVNSWWGKYGGGSNLSAESRAAFGRAIEQYKPGGGFGAGVEAALERGRTKALTAGGQALASAGLANTTMMAGLGKKYEEEVATPARANVESERASRLANLEAALAQAEQQGYESAADRSLRGSLASGQLGLGYAQLGAQQERAYLNQAIQNRSRSTGATSTPTQTEQKFPDFTRSGGVGNMLFRPPQNEPISWTPLKQSKITSATNLTDIDRTALGLNRFGDTSNLSFLRKAVADWRR